CPACAADEHDVHRDNAGLNTATGEFGCAYAKDTPDGRRHWDAIARALGVFVNGHGAAAAGPSSPAPQAGPRRRPPLRVGLGAFLAQVFPEADPYIADLLSSDGGGWLGGEEKVGKTYYALEEALCLALGLAVCGRFTVPTRRRVLFIEEEDPPR